MNATSSPASRDRVSWTRAIDWIRRTDSATASLASSEPVRRAWSCRSDEIVCRLFFTRWWISRMVASLESRSRSRWRTSVTSRNSTTAPDTPCESSIGIVFIKMMTSPRSTSTVTGLPTANASRIGASSSPRSPSRMPSRLACTPIRCRADTALGEAYSTAAARSSTMTPSPTRGDSFESLSSAGNGNCPAAIIRAKRLKMST